MQNMTKRDPEIYATTQRCWKSKQVQYSQYVNVITRYLKYLAHQTECEVYDILSLLETLIKTWETTQTQGAKFPPTIHQIDFTS